MRKKFYFLSLLLIIIFGTFLYRLYNLAYLNHDYYLNQYNNLNNIYISGSSAPRGRILDINGHVLVDNEAVKTILYHKPNNITKEEEIAVAKKLATLTNYTYEYNIDELKKYYLILNPQTANDLITPEEYELYKERKISSSELNTWKINRVTSNMLDSLSLEEKYSSYFYFLMNDGYIYDNKTLIKDVSDDIYARILEANLPGIFGDLDWKRIYPYNETLRSVFGNISNSLPKEKEYLLNEGYSLDDKIGISGLEEYYEEELRGQKALYKVINNNLSLVKEAQRGNDIILEIDIDMQLKIENIIKEEILKAKKTPNTKYYKESYALVSDPTTGDIKAIAGIRLITNNKNYSFQDVSINVIKNAYTVGSVVKGASMSVGYQNKAIDIGTTMIDGCVKLANIPAKCSYTRLGKLNDIRALAQSSNYYQFITALKVAGYDYTYNMQVNVTEEDFNKYRDTFASFGLGSLTGIDLPNETTGLKGEKIAPDLLMNLAIGQYDLYTPVSLLQYINTIANNGTRLKLNILHSIIKDEQIYERPPTILNTVALEEKYLQRVQAGFREVITHGTGYYYVNQKVEAAGKTGTSESYIDSDYNKTLDAYVLSNTFIMYAPIDNPQYSIVVISPNTSELNTSSNYNSQVNRYIARNINDFLFSIS